MPTPSTTETVDQRLSQNSCPPDDDRVSPWSVTELDDMRRDESSATPMQREERSSTPQPDSPLSPGQSNTQPDDEGAKRVSVEEELRMSSSDTTSPASAGDNQEESEQSEHTLPNGGYTGGTSSMNNEFSNVRLLPSSPSSFLRPGSKFEGTQQSERQIYRVHVEIKHVDLRESFLCGYLRIEGLTEDHPTLTTYFEGEIIGSKYSFLTQHEDWGSTDKVDLQHWAKFNAFRPFQKQARKGNCHIHGLAQRENIFMRWKEHFLVPDHRVRTITGASFEGFYYICFNQCQGTVSGIYFHAKSEKFQQLELKHVEDRGCFAAIEFR